MATYLNKNLNAVPTYQVDADGNIIGGSGAANTVQGNVASGATDAGNPVKVGGEYLAAAPTFANGQRTDLQTSANGSVFVSLARDTINRNPTADAQGSGTGIITYSQTTYFNGTTWDRARGDASAGLWTQIRGSGGAATVINFGTVLQPTEVAVTTRGHTYHYSPAAGAFMSTVGDANGTFMQEKARAQFFKETEGAVPASTNIGGVGRDVGASGVTQWTSYEAVVRADAAGATVLIQGSDDNSVWYTTATQTVTAGTALTISGPVAFRYNRAVFSNGSTAQTALIFRTRFTSK